MTNAAVTTFVWITVILNFATPFVGILLPTLIYGETDEALSLAGGSTVIKNYSGDFITEMGEVVNPNGNVEDTSDATDRLDITKNIGYVSKLLNSVDKYMFGGIVFLERVTTPFMNSETSKEFYLLFRGLATFTFIFFAWQKWVNG